jgi:LysR family transcriptional regulator, glycine cleavage system transcriptional activator
LARARISIPKPARIEAIVFRNLPLATLRTFDAAARHQSLAKASQELNLTDSAVSHQLRRLEEALGVDLFEKAGRGVVLTDAGRVFARSVATALHDIARTAHSLADAAQVGGRLTIACPPMFASKWLAKNIAAFCYDHPAIECQIQLADNDRVVDVPDADLGILFGSGAWPAKWSTLLETVAIAPACSPLLFHRAGHAFTKPTDLRDVILLHQDDGAEWRRWLAAEGDHAFEAYRRHLYCSDLSIAIDLAAEGAGVVLVSDTLSASHIADGLLLRPFARTILATGGWYVLCDDYKLERSNTRLFLHWLLGRFGRALTLPSAVEPDGNGQV